MSLSDYATAVIAVATIIYTLGTFLLWITTKQSLKLATKESTNVRKRLEAGFVADMVTWHRDIYKFFLSNEDYVKMLADSENIKVLKVKEGFLGTLLINNVMQAFYHHKFHLINEEIWNLIVIDTKELFNLRIVRERWNEIGNSSPLDFRQFIENDILP